MTVPLAAAVTDVWVEVPVTAAYDGAGDLYNNSDACLRVIVRNISGPAVECQIDGGAWTRLERLKSTTIEGSLAAHTIRLRKTHPTQAAYGFRC